MAIELFAFDLLQPDDLDGLTVEIDRLGPARIKSLLLLLRVAGEYEDGSRERARAALTAMLEQKNLATRTEFVTVVGCDGAATPCGVALIDLDEVPQDGGAKRLALGLSRIPPCADELIGTLEFAHLVEAATQKAIQTAGLSLDEVELVVINVPQPLTDVARRARRGRAAAALGAGAALGEVSLDSLAESDIVDNGSHFARRVQTFAGPGIEQLGIAVLGNRIGAGGTLVACHAVTCDLFDTAPIRQMLLDVGVTQDPLGQLMTDGHLLATIAKLGVHPSGRVLGAPTTIYGSVTPPEKHVRAAMSGVLGAVLSTTRIIGTFDPIQQAPLGGGTVCCIVRGR